MGRRCGVAVDVALDKGTAKPAAGTHRVARREEHGAPSVLELAMLAVALRLEREHVERREHEIVFVGSDRA